MVALNKVLIAGNLTDDPQLRATPGGAMVCEFTLAFNRSYKANSPRSASRKWPSWTWSPGAARRKSPRST